ncbi:MAG: hypothetical protein R3D59_00095 [Paracoccaceae bacterium]
MDRIETYNLFGRSDDLPDVVHCETIAARSVQHDWEFVPHRHARLHQVLMIARGGGRASTATAGIYRTGWSPMCPPAPCTGSASPRAPRAG